MAKSAKRSKRARKLSKGVVGTVIAGTLTAAASAGAETFNETSVGDFGGTLATATAVPVGTDIVIGQVQLFLGGEQAHDFFKFTGLEPGAPFTIDPSGSTIQTGTPEGEVLDSASNVLGSGALDGSNFTGFVPDDGVLIFHAFNSVAGEGVNYEISLSAPLAAAPVPGPSALTLGGLGAAIAGAFTWRRRKRAR